MKRLIFMVLALALLNSLWAEGVIIHTGSAMKYNEILGQMLDADFSLVLRHEGDVYFDLFTDNVISKSWIKLEPADIEKLDGILSKFKSWAEIAEKNNVEIDKLMPEYISARSVSWKYGGQWFSSNRINISFFADSITPSLHRLVIRFSDVSAKENEYITLSIDSLYLFMDAVSQLQAAIQPEAWSAIWADHEAAESSKELFQ